MIKFITSNGSLEIKSGDTVLLLTPMSNLAFTSLDLYNDIPRITLYNANVGINETLFTANLSQVADNNGNFFTVDSFLTYASLNFGMTVTESSSPTPTPTDGITFKFPIESGQTIAQNDFVQLNDNGEIFKVESSGSVPITMPIGSTATWSANSAPMIDRDNLVQWIDDTNFIIFFTYQSDPMSSNSTASYLIGGSVDLQGNFTYLNAPIEQVNSVPITQIEFALDETTLGNNVVSGITTSGGNTREAFIRAFEYDKTTQSFTFGTTDSIGAGLVDQNSSYPLVTNIGQGKYLCAWTYTNIAFIVTVSALTITKHSNTTLSSNNGRGHLVKVTNDKVILVLMNSSYNFFSICLDISGNVITLGYESTSTLQSYTWSVATKVLNSDNNFYISYAQSNMGGAENVGQGTYDAVSQNVVWTTTTYTHPNTLDVADISFYPTTKVLITSGKLNGQPQANIIDFASKSSITKVVGTISGTNVGCDVNSIGGVVFNYANSSNFGGTKEGLSSYGTLGNIVSTIDPTRAIGVASDELGNVEINGSVVTDSSLNLTVNQKVYVDVAGVKSSTNADGSLSIGYAISTTSYVLIITR